ncbi:MAG: hypothetical protein HY897_21635 [Deltaproteobacteria bacterium]|nr:hypothetical protein [Deltaproteobacteria bacterium]
MRELTETQLIERVKAGYGKLDEAERARLTRGVFSGNPMLFEQWVKECGPRLMQGWQRKTIAARKSADIGRLLDQTLLKENKEFLLAQVMQFYFVNVRPDMNDAFLGQLEETERGKDPAAAEAALTKVREQFAAEGADKLDFFEAALRWLAPEWFAPQPEATTASEPAKP